MISNLLRNIFYSQVNALGNSRSKETFLARMPRGLTVYLLGPGINTDSFIFQFVPVSNDEFTALSYGRTANTLVGKPEPFLGFGNATTTKAPYSGTLSRLARSSI
jgi:hypothetical protein